MPGKLYDETCRNTTDPELIPCLFQSSEVLHLDPDHDHLLLECIARNAAGTLKKAAVKRLGLKTGEPLPEETTGDELYFLLREQVMRVDSADRLLSCIEHGSSMHACFAFARLTGCSFPAPENDHLSHRTYACGCFEGLSDRERILYFKEYSPIISKFLDPKKAKLSLSAPSMIRKYRVKNALKLPFDQTLSAWILNKGEELKDQGKLTVRFGDCGSVSVFVSAADESICQAVLDEFTALLKSLGYLSSSRR